MQKKPADKEIQKASLLTPHIPNENISLHAAASLSSPLQQSSYLFTGNILKLFPRIQVFEVFSQ